MGRQTEFVQRLAKGARVFVAGRLDIVHYQSREGEPRTAFDIWADEIQDLTPRSTAEPASPGGLSQHPRSEQRSGTTGRPSHQGRPPVQDADDLPF